MFKDAIGRQWQLATIQCDFNLPERFDLSFVNEAGEKERPVVIHRAISGSLERFMGILIEHYNGLFPLWLAPVQAIVVPVSEAFNDYAHEVAAQLRTQDVRVQVDTSDDSLGKKIRNGEERRANYLLIVGEKEVQSQSINIRSVRTKEQATVSMSEGIAALTQEVSSRQVQSTY